MNSENAKLYKLLSWLCLFLGWFLGLSFLAFPTGIWLARRARQEGADAKVPYILNIASLIFIVVVFIFLMLLGSLAMML